MRRGKSKLSAVIGLLVSIGMIGGGVYWYNVNTAFVDTAVRTKGEVVDVKRIEETRRRDGRTREEVTYYPVVEFDDGDGQTHEFRSSAGSNPPAYSEGDRVEVLYDPGDPQQASINSFTSLWVGPLVTGGLGAVFALMSLGALVVRVLRG